MSGCGAWAPPPDDDGGLVQMSMMEALEEAQAHRNVGGGSKVLMEDALLEMERKVAQG